MRNLTFSRAAAVLLGVFLASGVLAGEAEIRAALEESLPEAAPDSIRPAPVAGFYEVTFGPRLFYVTEDGRYLLQGNLIDLKTRQDVTAPRRDQVRKQAIDTMRESMVVFAPKDGAVKHTITVFTDIDCGYCRQMHREIEQFMDEGIAVRYLLFPRSAPGTPSYQKAISVWCAEDRNEALTRAKAGEDPEARSCDNPVEEHRALGEMVGVRGTPTLVLDDGSVVPGYVPPKQLTQMLNGAPQR